MKRHHFATVSLAAVFLVCPCITSATEIFVVGYGDRFCTQFIAAMSKNGPRTAVQEGDELYLTEAAAYAEWLSGFSVAYQESHRVLVHATEDGLAAEVLIYCNSNPADRVEAAAVAVMRKLSSKSQH